MSEFEPKFAVADLDDIILVVELSWVLLLKVFDQQVALAVDSEEVMGPDFIGIGERG